MNSETENTKIETPETNISEREAGETNAQAVDAQEIDVQGSESSEAEIPVIENSATENSEVSSEQNAPTSAACASTPASTRANTKKGNVCVIAVCAAVVVFILAFFLQGFIGKTLNNITGTYNLYEIQGENGSTHEEIEAYEQIGFSIFMNIDEDKTFHLVMLGTDFDGTWECTNGKNVTFEPSLKELGMTNATIDGDTLTVTLLGEVTVFEKGEHKNVSDYAQ